MTHFTIKRQRELERREWLARAQERDRLERERLAAEQREQQRIDQLKNQWASLTAAKAKATLAGYQHATWQAKAQRLIRLIDGD